MENCEVMTSSTHSFAYSYRLVKKCFVKICKTSKCHNFLIFQPIFIRFSLLCLKIVTLSSEIKLNLLWSSSFNNLEKGLGKMEMLFITHWRWLGLGIWHAFHMELGLSYIFGTVSHGLVLNTCTVNALLITSWRTSPEYTRPGVYMGNVCYSTIK